MLIVAGVLTTLFGGAAFARGVVASHSSHVTPPPVAWAREPVAPPVQQTPPPEAAPKTPEPVVTAPPVATNHRLDEALAAVTPERPLATPTPTTHTEVVATPTETSTCVCRPRTQHLGSSKPYNAWGADHDSEGHLAVKSRLHTAWGKPISFNDDGSTCSCPRGTVRVRPHAGGGGRTSSVDHISPE